MPRGDGTGPEGKGCGTGRGLGRQAGNKSGGAGIGHRRGMGMGRKGKFFNNNKRHGRHLNAGQE